MSTNIIEHNTVTCYSCQLPTTQADAQPIHLLIPSGRRRGGVEVLNANSMAYECNNCLNASTDNEHLYLVYACSAIRTVSADTPEEAAVLMLQAHRCRSTRSVAVCRENRWAEYLDCEIVDGALQYSERVELA